MAVSQYVYTTLLANIADTTSNADVGNSIVTRNAINRAARKVLSDIDLRSTIRKTPLTTNVLDDNYVYAAPSDVKDEALIDLMPQINRPVSRRWRLVSADYFDRRKTVDTNLVAFLEDEYVRRLLISADVDDTAYVVSNFDALDAGGGTWAVIGDAASIAVDTENKVEGGASLRFDLTGAGTTAGIENSTLTAFDITDYLNSGVVTVWCYITSTTNLTNLIIKIGSSSSDYYTQTVTTQFDGTAFVAGWNLLKFSFASMTQTGTVVPTACDYVSFYMTKTSGKSDDGYRVDYMVLHTGEITDAYYYTKYPWQTNAAVYLENSTADTDYINADTDEFDLYVEAVKIEVYRDIRDYDQMKLAQNEYNRLKTQYKLKHPSLRLKKQYDYFRF